MTKKLATSMVGERPVNSASTDETGALRARNRQLESALRALVGDENRMCMYCGKAARLHTDDCPIVAGRKALDDATP